MADIKHYIITRFNLPLNYRVKSVSEGPPGLNPEYLAGRFEIFERFTIPSIEAQTCRDFRWLVFFDERTPRPFMEKIEGYGRNPRFEAVFAGEGFSLRSYIDDIIEKDRLSGTPKVLTTRLDNDDIILPDFVESVQSAARRVFPADKYLTSPVYYQYDVSQEIAIRRRLKKNHFISRTGNVFEGNQMQLPLNPAAYVRVPGSHAVEVLHDTNVINSARYSPGCALGREEYERLREMPGILLRDYDEYKRFCGKMIKRELPVYIKYQIGVIPRVLKKIKKIKEIK